MKNKNLTGFMSKDKPNLKYYSEGAEEEALNVPGDKTIWDILEKKLQEYIDIPALVYFKREISRPDFIESVDTWARTFKAMGVEEGEIVPIYGPFFPEICAMTLALNQIGAVSYFLKLEISEEALREETSDSKIAVVYDGMWKNVSNVFSDDKFKKIIVASASDSMLSPKKEIVTFMNYLNAKKEKSLIPNTNKYITTSEALKIADYYTGICKAPFVPNRVAFITSSSGTSLNGVIKGTMATNEAVISKLYQSEAADVNFNVGKKCLTNLPPTASTALCCLFLLPLFKGMTMINEPRLSQATYYDQIMMYKPQVALMTGVYWETFYRRVEECIRARKKVDLSFFEMPIIGGEGLTVKSLKWMNNLMKICNASVSMYNGYGLSEIFSVLSVERTGVEQKYEKPVVNVGVPLPGVTIGIFDDFGNELKYNNRGELWINDPSMMHGYYGKEELTNETKVNGWIHTGDVAEVDEDGLLYIYGRKSNSFTFEDETIYLFDIENKLGEHPLIKEAIVNLMPTESGDVILVAHLLLCDNSLKNEENLYKSLDEHLEGFLPSNIRISGYKVHDNLFPVSKTTAKKDRKKLMNILSGYKNGDYIDISLLQNDGYYQVIKTKELTLKLK